MSFTTYFPTCLVKMLISYTRIYDNVKIGTSCVPALVTGPR